MAVPGVNFSVVTTIALLAGCGGGSRITDAGADDLGDSGADAELSTCTPPATETCADPAPSFANAIAPILDRSCNTCHVPNVLGGPWPLTSYIDVMEWSPLIGNALMNCTMPPADGGTTLTETDRQILLAWLACGSPDN